MGVAVPSTQSTVLADFPSVLDEAIRQLLTRLEALEREQKEVELSLMSLKQLRANVGHLPGAAIRTVLAVMQDQAGRQRSEVMDDEDGPACAEPLSDVELMTNYEKIVQFFLVRDNQPATNHDMRGAIGASRGAVAQILYTSHAEKFERPSARIAGKVAWKLRDSVYRAELEKRALMNRTRAVPPQRPRVRVSTGDPCPVSGIYRCECGSKEERAIVRGHLLPPCPACNQKAYWTLVRRADVKSVVDSNTPLSQGKTAED